MYPGFYWNKRIWSVSNARMNHNDYTNPERALAYLDMADEIPHRSEAEGVLLSFIPPESECILDLGTGDGRLLSLLQRHCANAQFIGIDNSETMLEAAKERFQGNPDVRLLSHDLEQALPEMGTFDVIVSSFAIHHCTNERKRTLSSEIFDRLRPGGVFCNLDHVASPTCTLHQKFLQAMGMTQADEDRGNILLDVETQLDWLRQAGFTDVDCYWKWLELSLFGGRASKD